MARKYLRGKLTHVLFEYFRERLKFPLERKVTRKRALHELEKRIKQKAPKAGTQERKDWAQARQMHKYLSKRFVWSDVKQERAISKKYGYTNKKGKFIKRVPWQDEAGEGVSDTEIVKRNAPTILGTKGQQRKEALQQVGEKLRNTPGGWRSPESILSKIYRLRKARQLG